MAKRHRFLDIGEEFQLVLDIFRREQGAVLQAANILGTVDDFQMTGVINKTRIAGMDPTIRGFGLLVASSFL